MKTRIRDSIVRENAGRPIARIGFRAKTVHCIFPREKVNEVVLEKLAVTMKNMLGD